MQEINFTRGDNYGLKFQRMYNDTVLTELPNYMYFTVKTGYLQDTVVFQKTLENGITKDDENYYHIEILPEDTNGLNYQIYNWDIEVITDTYKRTIASGILEFNKETTLPVNEVK